VELVLKYRYAKIYAFKNSVILNIYFKSDFVIFEVFQGSEKGQSKGNS